jgi:hypothetical protein
VAANRSGLGWSTNSLRPVENVGSSAASIFMVSEIIGQLALSSPRVPVIGLIDLII